VYPWGVRLENTEHTRGRDMSPLTAAHRADGRLNYPTSCSYGYYRELPYPDIMKRIDWTITKGYLAIDYFGRLPVLTFTAAGWKIERNTYSDELLMKLTQIATGSVQTADIQFLKDKDRSLILMLLEKIEAGKDDRLLSVLEEWRKIDYRKVQTRISEVIQSLESQKENAE